MRADKPSWLSPPPENIIVRMPNWIGDLVMATPVLEDLRKKFPSAKITAMCQFNISALLKNDPNIDEIYSFKRPSGWIHRSEHLAIIEDLRRGNYDLGVLLTNSFSSGWWFWRGNVANRIGFTDTLRNLLLTKIVPWPKELETQHQVITYKNLLEPLGIQLSSTSPALYITAEEEDAAKEQLLKLGIEPRRDILIGINPGAAYGSAKCWLPERYRAVVERLLKDPRVRVVFFGDQSGASLVDEICKGLPEERVIQLAGKTTLRTLMALIRLCAVFLTNDSGPMHIAAALNVPLLALFGSTSDVKTGPYKSGKVIHKHVECSPCYKRKCPIDFRCMKRITVEEVYAEIKDLLP